LITKAIEEKWVGLDYELAIAARISTSGLTALKAKGATEPTKNLRKLCRVLGVDVRKLLQGHLVYVKTLTTPRRPDLHDMLNRLIGTPDEQTVERLLRGLVETGQH
jgi:DNA-binding Xre family transcriptional regulator